MIRIYTVPSYFQGPRISRILYIYNVISQLYVTRIDVAREQNRFTVVVSLGIHTRVAILFSHRPANAKRRTPPRRTRIYARRLLQYFRYHPPLFPPNRLFPDSILTRNIRPPFALASGRRNLKTRYDTFFLLELFVIYIYIFFFVYIRKVIYVEYNDLINLIFFFLIDFLYLYFISFYFLVTLLFSISWIRVSYFFIFKYLELLNMIV